MEERRSGGSREAACPRCGSAFRCGAGTGECWCQALPPVMPLVEGACLCPACLKAAMEGADPDAAPSGPGASP